MELIINIPDEDHKQLKDGHIPFNVLNVIQNGTPLPKGNKCKWIHYNYRTVCPKEHDIDNPYWRIPENRMDALKYCPYCGKEIEIEVDEEE